MAVSIDGSGPITGLTSIASPTTLNGLTIPTTGFGKVLQVVRATDVTQRGTSSTSFVDASISVTITPQEATSNILLLWRFEVSVTNVFLTYVITDSANNIISGTSDMGIGTTTGGILASPGVGIGWDAPGTTSATTYKGRFKASSGTVYVNPSGVMGQLFAIEVAA